MAATAQHVDGLPDFAATLSKGAAYLAGSADSLSVDGVPSRSDLARQALQRVKQITDSALYNERLSVSFLEFLVNSVVPSAPTTRSQAAAKAKLKKPKKITLAPTALNQLFVGDNSTQSQFKVTDEMIWAQLELRYNNVYGWIRQITSTMEVEDEHEDTFAVQQQPVVGDNALTADDDDEDDDEELEDYDLDGVDEDEIQRLLNDEEATEDEDYHTDDDDEDEEDSDTEHKAANESYTTKLNDAFSLSDEDVPSFKKPRKNKRTYEEDTLTLENIDVRDQESSKTSSKSKRRRTEVNDDFFDLEEFEREAIQGETEMMKKLKGTDENVNGQGQDSESEEESDVDLFKTAIDGPMDNDDEEDEEDEEMRDGQELGDAGYMYQDFFDPPQGMPKKQKPVKQIKPVKRNDTSPVKGKVKPETPVKKGGVSFSEDVAVQSIPSKNKGLKVSLLRARPGAPDEDEDDSEDEEGDDDVNMMWVSEMLDENLSDADDDDDYGSEEGSVDLEMALESGSVDEKDGSRTMGRLDDDLFDDGFDTDVNSSESDDERGDEVSSDKKLSRSARRMKQLSKQISELERQNVSAKNWTMMGEVSAKHRPQNSLLEQDLDFEHVQKLAPAVTEEKTQDLVGLIKQRILNDEFDDVIRRRPIDLKAFLPSRMLELQDTVSSKSLAEIYADDFRDSKSRSQGEKVQDVRDVKLLRVHEELTQMFEDLCGQLDSLSNAHFTPKQPKTTITTISNVSTVTMESTLPTSTSTSTLLAPEEIHSVDPKTIQRDQSTLTHAQKQLERKQRKKLRNSMTKVVDKMVGRPQRGSDSKQSTKAQKEESLKKLLGTKGVTVIGKTQVGKKKKSSTSVKNRGEKKAINASTLKL